MMGCRRDSDKVCEVRFFYSSGRILANFIVLVVLSSSKTGKRLDEPSFVVCFGRCTTDHYFSRRTILLGTKTASGTNAFVEVAVSVTNISCITQVTLKLVNY